MTRLWMAAACGLCLMPAARGEPKVVEKSGKLDPKTLTGTYTIVRGERNGKPIPEARLKGSIVTFTAEKIYGTDKDKKEFFSSTYTLDAASAPATIKMVSSAPKKDKADGVIEADGDTVRLAYALPGGEAPKKFKTGLNQHFFELKRVKGAK